MIYNYMDVFTGCCAGPLCCHSDLVYDKYVIEDMGSECEGVVVTNTRKYPSFNLAITCALRASIILS